MRELLVVSFVVSLVAEQSLGQAGFSSRGTWAQ